MWTSKWDELVAQKTSHNKPNLYYLDLYSSAPNKMAHNILHILSAAMVLKCHPEILAAKFRS